MKKGGEMRDYQGIWEDIKFVAATIAGIVAEGLMIGGCVINALKYEGILSPKGSSVTLIVTPPSVAVGLMIIGEIFGKFFPHPISDILESRFTHALAFALGFFLMSLFI